MKNNLDKAYWGNKYKDQLTGWDLGEISPPIKEYIDQVKDKSIKILIPGAGNSHEAEYLCQKGFINIVIIDITEQPLINFKKRVPEFPDSQLKCIDFFDFEGEFDLIIEQTFFCALFPTNRVNYSKKMYNLLKPKGKLIGLLFDFPLNDEGPPFGGSKTEYLKLFNSLFDIKVLERAYNSAKQRLNRELFFIFEKK